MPQQPAATAQRQPAAEGASWSPADLRCVATFAAQQAFAALLPPERAQARTWTPAATEQWLARSRDTLAELEVRLGVPEAQRAELEAQALELSRGRMRLHQAPPPEFGTRRHCNAEFCKREHCTEAHAAFQHQLAAIAWVLRADRITPYSGRALTPRQQDPAAIGTLRGEDLRAWTCDVFGAVWRFLDDETLLLTTKVGLTDQLLNQINYHALTCRPRVEPAPAPEPAPEPATDSAPVPAPTPLFQALPFRPHLFQAPLAAAPAPARVPVHAPTSALLPAAATVPAPPPVPLAPVPVPAPLVPAAPASHGGSRRGAGRKKQIGFSKTAIRVANDWAATGTKPKLRNFSTKNRYAILQLKADIDAAL